MIKSLEGKRILFLEPKFFGYEESIKNEFINQGAQVDIISSGNNNVFWRISSHFSSLREKLENKKFLRSVLELKNKSYDFIFIIRGGLLSKKNVSFLLDKFPEAKSILYLWDSLEENPNSSKLVPLFDEIISFDKQDCDKYGFKFLPLFYTPEFLVDVHEQKTEFKYDISFVGRDHSDRYLVISKLQKEFKRLKLNPYIFLFTTKLGYIKRRFLNKRKYPSIKKSDFRFDKIHFSQIAEIYQNSFAVLDVELVVQSGLTMRTFELLAARKKMITTNTNILDFELYNSQNILVIDRHKPELPRDFFESPFLYDERIKQYSIQNWVKNIFQYG